MNQSELSAIERLAQEINISVQIEMIENGAIVYLGETFGKEEFVKLRRLFTENATILDPAKLPAQHAQIYDSFTGETIYFKLPGEQYFQNLLKIIGEFVQKPRSADLLKEIYKRVVKRDTNSNT